MFYNLFLFSINIISFYFLKKYFAESIINIFSVTYTCLYFISVGFLSASYSFRHMKNTIVNNTTEYWQIITGSQTKTVIHS